MVVRLWEQTSDRVKKKKSTYIFLSRRTELVSSDELENSIIFSIRRHFIESTSHPHLGYGKISVKWCNAHFFMTSFFEMIIQIYRQVLVNAKVAVLSKYTYLKEQIKFLVGTLLHFHSRWKFSSRVLYLLLPKLWVDKFSYTSPNTLQRNIVRENFIFFFC